MAGMEGRDEGEGTAAGRTATAVREDAAASQVKQGKLAEGEQLNPWREQKKSPPDAHSLEPHVVMSGCTATDAWDEGRDEGRAVQVKQGLRLLARQSALRAPQMTSPDCAHSLPLQEKGGGETGAAPMGLTGERDALLEGGAPTH